MSIWLLFLYHDYLYLLHRRCAKCAIVIEVWPDKINQTPANGQKSIFRWSTFLKKSYLNQIFGGRRLGIYADEGIWPVTALTPASLFHVYTTLYLLMIFFSYSPKR